jgi:hypothetical protein
LCFFAIFLDKPMPEGSWRAAAVAGGGDSWRDSELLGFIPVPFKGLKTKDLSITTYKGVR